MRSSPGDRSGPVRALTGAVVMSMVAVTIGPAAAQTDEPPPTTTTAPEVDVDPALDTGRGEGAAPETPPAGQIDVPEPPPVFAPTGVDRRVRHLLLREVATARAAMQRAEASLGSAVADLEDRTAAIGRLLADIAVARASERQSSRTAEVAAEQVATRARNAYVNGPRQLAGLLAVGGPEELARRRVLASAVLQADLDGAAAAQVEHRDTSSRLADLQRSLGAARERRAVAADGTAALRSEVARARDVLAMFQAGSAIAVAGFVFPVGDPHNFADTWGAPRMVGTTYEHWHQGTDIFAARDTPLYAVERGAIARVGTDVLGGTKLWLVGATGTRYYYAHLSGYGPGIAEGVVVEAGTVVGYVGNTGNALTTPPHLHFEIHPEGIGPVNPAPLLRVADRYRAD